MALFLNAIVSPSVTLSLGNPNPLVIQVSIGQLRFKKYKCLFLSFLSVLCVHLHVNILGNMTCSIMYKNLNVFKITCLKCPCGDHV